MNFNREGRMAVRQTLNKYRIYKAKSRPGREQTLWTLAYLNQIIVRKKRWSELIPHLYTEMRRVNTSRTNSGLGPRYVVSGVTIQ